MARITQKTDVGAQTEEKLLKAMDFDNDPYFVEKHKRAEAFLKKIGLPKEIEEEMRKKKSQG